MAARRRTRATAIIIAALLAVSLASDGLRAETKPADSAGAHTTRYQCPMHPNIVSDHPGKCPICGMELQPVNNTAGEGFPGRAAVDLGEGQRQLINLRLAPVERQPVEISIRAVGVVAVDQEKTAVLNSRVMGWIEKLYVNKIGQTVRRGEKLASIYSPDLLAAQQEYLIAREAAARPGDDNLAAAARQRLRLWGVSDEQIQTLETSGKPSADLDIFAPAGGTVVEKKVEEQQMVSVGAPMFRIADLSRIWVNADIYESELPDVSEGQDAVVTLPAYPGRPLAGKVDFVYPFVNGKTRTTTIRVILDNPDGILRPDMYANVELRRKLGEQTTIPATAVFDTGQRQYVFVERNAGHFVPVPVVLGARSGDRQVVQSGLSTGDRVVVSGNFLLDSESQLKAAAGDTTSNDDHAEEPRAMTPEGKPMAAESAADASLQPLIEAYLASEDAIASDRWNDLRDALDNLTTAAGRLGAHAPSSWRESSAALAEALRRFPDRNDNQARDAFGNVSAAMIGLLRVAGADLPSGVTLMHCPMWKSSAADWLQHGAKTKNPFYGLAMQTCGQALGWKAGASHD